MGFPGKMQQVRSGGKGCFAVPTLGRYVPSPFAGRCWLAASGSVLLYCARFVFTWTRFGLIPGVFLPKMLGVVAAPPPPPPPPAPRAPMPSAAGRWLRARPLPVRGAERGPHFLGERRWPVLSCGARKRRGGRAGDGGRSAETLSR
jgi:hypothetical protein